MIPAHVEDRAYEAKVRATTPGLAYTTATAFQASSTSAKRLDQDTPLSWGAEYLVVWAEHIQHAWPSAVERSDLASKQGWKAAAIRLPNAASTKVASWGETFLGRTIRYPPPRIGVVSPAIVSVSDEDVVQVPAGSPVVIAVVAPPGSPATVLHLVNPSGERSALPLDDSTPALFEIGVLPLGVTELFVDDPDSEDLQLEPIELPVLVEPEATLVLATPGADDSEISLPVFSAAAAFHLERVRTGGPQLTRFVTPPGITCIVRSRTTAFGAVREQRFVHARRGRPESGSAGGEPMKRLVDYIQEVLGAAELEIDFGNFGAIAVRRLDRREPAFRLPSAIRERMRWLVAIPGTDLPASNRLAVPNSLQSTKIDARDADLLQRFFTRGRWPARLLPHVTALTNELVGILGER